MFNSRYSEGEFQQWQDACATAASCASEQSAATGRASMAKGQAEAKSTRTTTAKNRAHQPNQHDWASECLFDWYNG